MGSALGMRFAGIAPMTSPFDSHATTYREEVQRSIGFAGVDADFFTEVKAAALLRIAGSIAPTSTLSALDVGCGVGETDRYLSPHLRTLDGTDVSRASLEIARSTNPGVTYVPCDDTGLPYPAASFDLVFAICVLHHVDTASRFDFAREMTRVTRPGGATVLIEHNPVNPLTRLVVSRCSMDEGVQLISHGAAARLLRAAGSSDVHSQFILFFPTRNRLARRAERRLGRLPLGAQYVTWGSRPATAGGSHDGKARADGLGRRVGRLPAA